MNQINCQIDITAQRLTVLERKLTNYKKLNVALALVFLILIGLGAESENKSNIINAKKIQVRNSEDKVAVELTTTREGGGIILVYGNNDLPAATLSAEEHGGTLSVWQKSGGPVGIFGSMKYGGGILLNRRKDDPAQKVDIMSLGAYSESMGLSLKDSQDNPKISLLVGNEKGETILLLNDRSEKSRLLLNAEAGNTLIMGADGSRHEARIIWSSKSK